jgi:hypothetical protein
VRWIRDLLACGFSTRQIREFLPCLENGHDSQQCAAKHMAKLHELDELETPKPVPTGWNMLVRHPDGMLVEYVEHRDKHPGDILPDATYLDRIFAP